MRYGRHRVLIPSRSNPAVCSLISLVLLFGHFVHAQSYATQYVSPAEHHDIPRRSCQLPRLGAPSFCASCCQWTTPVLIDTTSLNLLRQRFPAMALDHSGNIAVAWTEIRAGDGYCQILVERSTNKGETWTRSVPYGYAYERYAHDIAFDRAGNLWLLWDDSPAEFQPFFLNLSRSTDNGQTFTTLFSSRAYAAPFFEPKIAIDSANNVFMLWDDLDFKLTRFVQGNIAQRIDSYIPHDTLRVDFWCSLSLGPSTEVYAVWTGVRHISPGNDRVKVYCSASSDTGRSFLLTSRVDTTEVINSYSTQHYPSSTVDSNGSLYIAYTREVGGVDSSSIMVTASSDHGSSFMAPIQVIELGTNLDPTLCTDVQNSIDLLWSGNEGAYFSRSTDSGQTFSVPQIIVAGTPDIAGDHVGNLFAVFESAFRIAFARTNVLVVVPDRPILASQVELAQNFPNPFNGNTAITFNLTSSAVVKLAIYNMLAREIEVLVRGRVATGVHRIVWSPKEISSGVYFYRLDVIQPSTITSRTRKLIYLR